MKRLIVVALLAVATAFVGCQSVPSPSRPILVDITGNGRLTRAAGSNPDTFGFALVLPRSARPAARPWLTARNGIRTPHSSTSIFRL